MAEETKADNKKKEYLKQLVEIKIQNTKINQLSHEAPIFLTSSRSTNVLLKLDEFGFTDDVLLGCLRAAKSCYLL